MNRLDPAPVTELLDLFDQVVPVLNEYRTLLLKLRFWPIVVAPNELKERAERLGAVADAIKRYNETA